MTIVYLGTDQIGSTSLHRIKALERLGHKVIISNPQHPLKEKLKPFFANFIHYRTGYAYLQTTVLEWLRVSFSKMQPFDVVWVDGGEYFGKNAVQYLNSFNKPVVFYNVDDPTGKRDGGRFASALSAIPYYSLCVTVREPTYHEIVKLGAKKAMLVTRSYDEIEHKPFDDRSQIPKEFLSEVAFIGTWIPKENRDEFLYDLVKAGIPIRIWGNNWHKSPLINQLKPYLKPTILTGRDYVAAIGGSKVCIGLLSKGNRDLHTQRSLEVPYAGGVFCAERTEEHMAFYKEGEEAMFWKDSKECIEKCKILLENDELRERIRENGHKRVIANKSGNEEICKKILEAL